MHMNNRKVPLEGSHLICFDNLSRNIISHIAKLISIDFNIIYVPNFNKFISPFNYVFGIL